MSRTVMDNSADLIGRNYRNQRERIPCNALERVPDPIESVFEK